MSQPGCLKARVFVNLPSQLPCVRVIPHAEKVRAADVRLALGRAVKQIHPRVPGNARRCTFKETLRAHVRFTPPGLFAAFPAGVLMLPLLAGAAEPLRVLRDGSCVTVLLLPPVFFPDPKPLV